MKKTNIQVQHVLSLLVAIVTVCISSVLASAQTGKLTLPAVAIAVLAALQPLFAAFSGHINPQANAALAKKFGLITTATMLLAAVCLLSGCLHLETTAQQGQDLVSVQDCIEENWGQPATQIAGECVGGEVSVAEDLIADIEAIFEASSGAPSAAYITLYSKDAAIVARVAARRAARR